MARARKQKASAKRVKRTENGIYVSTRTLANFRQIGEALQGSQLPVRRLISELAICQEKAICWACAQRAANIRVKIVSQMAGMKTPGVASLAKLTGSLYPPSVLLKQGVRDAIADKVDKDLCGTKCGLACRCVGPEFSFTIAHDQETQTVYTDDMWNQVPAAKSVGVTRVEIDFDIQLVVTVGLCLEAD